MNKIYFPTFVFLLFLNISCTKTHSESVNLIDTTNMDLTVKPGNNFYQYVNGGWMNKINDPEAAISDLDAFSLVSKKTDSILTEYVAELIETNNYTADSDIGKGINLYKTYIDSTKRNAQGIQPLLPELQAIDQINNLNDLNQFLSENALLGGYGLYELRVGSDLKDSNKNSIFLTASGLEFPNTSYYTDKDEKTQQLKAAYKKHIAIMLQFASISVKDAEQAAENIFAIENQLAQASLTQNQMRNANLTYNPTTLAELQQLNAEINWKTIFEAAGLKNAKTLNVKQPNYIKALANVLQSQNIDEIKNYLKWKLLASKSEYLSEEIALTHQNFYNQYVFNRQPYQTIYDEEAVEVINEHLPQALGKIYVEQYFSEDAKEKVEEMITNIIEAYRIRINQLDWMDAKTKKGAIDKLDKLIIKVGYPDEWEDYSALTLFSPENGTYYENQQQLTRWQNRNNFAQYKKTVNKANWDSEDAPQEIDAYYSPSNNEILFTAAFLQPPYFDVLADDAVNYGAIGTVIGHEISHAFDDQGSQYDANGNLTNWWTDKDAAHFKTLGKKLSAYFSNLQHRPGMHLNGENTLGENIGDFGGVQAAYDALQLQQKKQKQGMIDGFTPEQRFFISYTNVWRTNATDDDVAYQIKTDYHAPDYYRSFVPLQHTDAWYKAFTISPSDSLYIGPENRIKTW
ncbi:M13 family metallopeptidase [Flavobacterium agricola]|uniref:M13 family metallopeptidase n=1 Tax=Flavobacterium agricola TaxID=2870839 RepID=A0ABY6LYF1_9FLAO|nr:M13 family metallopeptidase [Flavobacterium agricola]UYW00450.1 M13 family metallopeptidase [Flavobacterium agricola]